MQLSENERVKSIRATMRRKYAKLSNEQVKEMRRLFSTGRYSQSALARKFKITPTQARNIVLHKQWKD